MSLTIDSRIDLHDSDIDKMDKGPLAYAKSKAGTSMNIDQFAKDMKEQFANIGFNVEVKVYDTDQQGTYAFEVEIQGRNALSLFDPDRQVHEVTSNFLQLPGEQTGFIPSKEGIDRLLAREAAKARKKGQHRH